MSARTDSPRMKTTCFGEFLSVLACAGNELSAPAAVSDWMKFRRFNLSTRCVINYKMILLDILGVALVHVCPRYSGPSAKSLKFHLSCFCGIFLRFCWRPLPLWRSDGAGLRSYPGCEFTATSAWPHPLPFRKPHRKALRPSR
jgi:hypothetical protein